jgi:Fe-Mn family superoxide dismutase
MRQQRGRQGTLPVFGTPATSGDVAAEGIEAEAQAAIPPLSHAQQTAANRASPRSAGELTPVAVLNLYQLAYLDKYGVFGAGQYARDWFRTLDWDRIQNRAASGAY